MKRQKCDLFHDNFIIIIIIISVYWSSWQLTWWRCHRKRAMACMLLLLHAAVTWCFNAVEQTVQTLLKTQNLGWSCTHDAVNMKVVTDHAVGYITFPIQTWTAVEGDTEICYPEVFTCSTRPKAEGNRSECRPRSSSTYLFCYMISRIYVFHKFCFAADSCWPQRSGGSAVTSIAVHLFLTQNYCVIYSLSVKIKDVSNYLITIVFCKCVDCKKCATVGQNPLKKRSPVISMKRPQWELIALVSCFISQRCCLANDGL